MNLPESPVEWETIVVDGQDVKVRSISYTQALEIGQLMKDGRVEEATVLGIAYGTDTPADEVRAWAARTRSGVVEALAAAVAHMSGLTEGASKSV